MQTYPNLIVNTIRQSALQKEIEYSQTISELNTNATCSPQDNLKKRDFKNLSKLSVSDIIFSTKESLNKLHGMSTKV